MAGSTVLTILSPHYWCCCFIFPVALLLLSLLSVNLVFCRRILWNYAKLPFASLHFWLRCNARFTMCRNNCSTVRVDCCASVCVDICTHCGINILSGWWKIKKLCMVFPLASRANVRHNCSTVRLNYENVITCSFRKRNSNGFILSFSARFSFRIVAKPGKYCTQDVLQHVWITFQT